MHFTIRYAANKADLKRLYKFTSQMWAVFGPCQSMHVGDLLWRFHRREDSGLAKLFPMWFDDQKRLVGYIQYGPPDSCDMVVDREHASAELELQMLEWGEARCRQELAASGATVGLTVGCFDSDRFRRDLLTRQGYQAQTSAYIHFLRNLERRPVEAIPLQSGYCVGNIANLDTFERSLQSGRQIYGRQKLDLLRCRRILDSGWFSFEQDIVARDEEKRIVAACLWWYDTDNRMGEFEPVGCHPGHRRKGLASAVIVEGLRQMQRRGAVAAVAYTKNDNDAAIRCYTSLDFKPVGIDRDWQKTLSLEH